MRWFFLLITAILLPFLAAEPTRAQDAPPALVVRLRDVRGVGVAGAEVIITDDSGTTVLARAISDATGTVAIGPLPVADVRVFVHGRLAGGMPLVLPGADAQGIAIILGASPVTLELRSEADGTVRPDPATELTLEPGVVAPAITLDPAQVPPAPPASAALVATVAAFPTAQEANAAVATHPAAGSPSETMPTQPAATPLWPGLLLLGALLIAVATIAIVQLRWGRS